VVRPAKLRLALLAVLVGLGHVASLEWFARQADAISGLALMAPPMYTRMLKPQAAPPVLAAAGPVAPAMPRVRAAPQPRPPASSAQERQAKEKAEAPPLPDPEPLAQEALPALPQEDPVAQGPQQPASGPVAAAPTPVAAASAPATAASAPGTDMAALGQWPADTRLTYDVTGAYRGPVTGTAHVEWLREGARYQVRLDVTIRVVVPITQTLTSQGEITPAGLIPRAYEEMRTGGKRRIAHFGDEVLVLEKGSVPRPPGVQDTASQFVELAQRFATGKETLAVGGTVAVWLARPGGLDRWVYDVAGREVVQTALMGDVEAFHLKPRAIPNPRGNITAEMWFAPSLQYLPVKIKVLMGTEAWLELVVERIEQR
jgi:hypothetical protein